MEGRLKSLVIINDTTLDFEKMSGGLGIRHLSIKNAGTSTLIIDDATQEEVLPDEPFYIESPIALVNTDFRLKFNKKDKETNKVFVRYIVEVPRCR